MRIARTALIMVLLGASCSWGSAAPLAAASRLGAKGARRITLDLGPVGASRGLLAVARSGDVQLVAEAVPGPARQVSLRDVTVAEALNTLCDRNGLEWGVAGETPIVVVRKAGVHRATSAPAFFAALDELSRGGELTYERAARILRAGLSVEQEAALATLFPPISLCFEARRGTALLGALADQRRRTLQTEDQLALTEEEAGRLWMVVPDLRGRPVALAIAPAEGPERPRHVVVSAADEERFQTEMPVLPATLDVWDRPYSTVRALVPMEGRHEGRDDRISRLEVEDADLRTVLRAVSGPDDEMPLRDLRARRKWFAIVLQRDVGNPRMTARLDNVATRQDLLPAIEAAFRCRGLAGVGFVLLVPDSAELVRQGEGQEATDPTATFGPWLARGGSAALAFAATEVLGFAEVEALVAGQTVEVAFFRLSEAGRAAFVARERELREKVGAGTHVGPVPPQIDWESGDDLLVRLVVQRHIGLQVTCMARTTDGGFTSF